jgi:hypothetical protein
VGLPLGGVYFLADLVAQVLVDMLGLIAALASFRSGWNATALPAAAPQEKELSDIVAPPIETPDALRA